MESDSREEASGTTDNQGSHEESETAAPRKRKKRLWLRVLIFAGIGIAVLATPVVIVFGVMKPQLYGNFWPDFDSGRDEDHFERLEAERAEATAEIPAVTPEDAEIARLRALPSWPAFRGANHDGVSRETGLMREWPPEGPPEVFRRPVGLGWGGFAMGLGRAYTIEQRRDHEAVTCYRIADGAEMWVHAYPAAFSESMGGDGPRSTPTLAGERLIVLGATGDLHCLDAMTGAVLWHHNILTETGSKNLYYGTSCAPLALGDRVVVTSSGQPAEDSESAAATDGVLFYALASGELLRTSFPLKQAYSSLVPARIGGTDQLLNLAGASLNGLDAGTGEPLWSFPWGTQNDINCAQPIPVGDDLVWVSSGYGQGNSLVRITGGAGVWSAAEVWHNKEMRNKLSSSILIGGHIYGLNEGILACIEMETGKRMWKKGRYGHGQLLYADERLYVIAEDGELFLLKVSPEGAEETGAAEAVRGKTWNHLALADGRLMVRNDREMVCYNVRELN